MSDLNWQQNTNKTAALLNIFQRHTVLWWVLSHGLGYGTVVIPGVLGLSIDVDHNVFWASIYTAVSRAIFAFAIGVGILGTTNGVGGKKVFQQPKIIQGI